MYKTTQLSQSNNTEYCWLNFIHEQFKSITGIAVLMLFLVGTSSLNAQVIPCIDGNPDEWGDEAQLNLNLANSYVEDALEGVDDAYHTNAKDIHNFGVGGNQWTITQVLNKGNIMNAAATIAVYDAGDPGDPCDYSGSSFGGYVHGNTYLFFAGDRKESNGTSTMGFWFLLNGTAPVGTDPGYFEPEHADGDLLLVADFAGGKFATLIVYEWVVDITNPEGGYLNDITGAVGGVVAQNTAGTIVDVPLPWQDHVKPGQTEYLEFEFYEGAIDITPIFDLEDPDNFYKICNAAWLLETRASDKTTAKLKDFVGGSFQIPPVVSVGDDTVCEGSDASLSLTVYEGDGVTPVADPIAEGYTITWYDSDDNPVVDDDD
ncbi:MAG TPA: hypothetical protein VKN14_10510, partial [Flavobacteriaceae bacterium]|nr:hypothetical protein [Flavobacteriaceae bacterium]